jgi:hypothetical protein
MANVANGGDGVKPDTFTAACHKADAAQNRKRKAKQQPAPKPKPVYDGPPEDGACLLDEVHAYLGRFVSYPSAHAHVAHVLWIAHAHLMEAWVSTPRLAFLSPELGSGKTRALEVTMPLVPLPVEAINVSPTYLFRKVGSEDGRPTILFDEIDTVFGPKAKKDNEDIRALLNAGHRKGAVAGRCVVRGNIVSTEEIPAYCAVAVAGIDWLPDTLLSRSVIIRMKRRRTDEKVDAFRVRVHGAAGEALRNRLAAWAYHHVDALADAWPELPHGIEDRNADVWEALLAVADAAGGDWPVRARQAAVFLVEATREAMPGVSLGLRLLTDIKAVFGEDEALASVPGPRFWPALLPRLHALDESPWGDLKGKPLDPRGLAARLRQYGIRPRTVRLGPHQEDTAKGFQRQDFFDAWERYCSALPLGQNAVTSVTSVTAPANEEPSVTDVTENPGYAHTDANVTDVTDVTENPGKERAGHSMVCEHCGGEELPGDPVQLCAVDDEQHFIHRRCQDEWRDEGLDIPASLRRN